MKRKTINKAPAPTGPSRNFAPHSSWSHVANPVRSERLAPEEFWARLGL